jgi:phosphate transport system substrate-binding protein
MEKRYTIAKIAALLLIIATVAALAVGCTAAPPQSGAPTGEAPANENPATGDSFDLSQEILVVSREEGSGTRGAFIELFEIEEKDADGNKIDMTTEEASITNSTSAMMMMVEGKAKMIGYISLGSLNDTVKAVKIDGAAPAVENVKDGTYKVSRPFNVATKGELSKEAADFMAFILSEDGQKVVEDAGYISVEENEYTPSKAEGKVVVAGSSSVTPVMEKLKEAYEALNPDAEIEIQMSDSSTGMTSVIDKICDIGMASRELKDSEIEAGLTATVIATDGIAIIVNKENPIEDLSSENVKAIYKDEGLTWADVQA